MATSIPEAEQAPSRYGEGAEAEKPKETKLRDDGKWELEETDAWEVLGYSFSTW